MLRFSWTAFSKHSCSPIFLQTKHQSYRQRLLSTVVDLPKMSNYLEISPYKKLLSHSRYLMRLRSSEGRYHSLILFRLASGAGADGESSILATGKADHDETQKYKQIYVVRPRVFKSIFH